MSEQQDESVETPEEVESSQNDEVHYIQDLEERKNASGPVTTMAVGEEKGNGGTP